MAGVPVFVNVYQLIPSDGKGGKLGNDALELIKMGVYHAGVEVLGTEWSFGMDPSGKNDPATDGIFSVRPRTAVGTFKEQVPLGNLPSGFSRSDVDAVLNQLRPNWKACTYHLLNHNCCYFSLAFAKALNPEFEKTFPHYVYRAAGVGDKVVPAAVLSSLTAALSPPTPLPEHLIGKIDVPNEAGGVPPPGPARSAPAKAESSGGPGGLLGGALGGIKKAASAATGAVRGLVDDHDRKTFQKEFPGENPAALVQRYTAHVVHIHREQKAHVYVTDKFLGVGGDNKLAVKLPYEQIASLHYGVKIPPATPGLPAKWRLQPKAEGTKLELLVYTKDGKMIPIFDFQGHIPGAVTGKIAAVTGGDVNKKLDEAFTCIDEAWRKVARM